MKISASLQQQIAQLPSSSGVYFFFSSESSSLPLYIGKSIAIKKRVQSHFYGAKEGQRKCQHLGRVVTIKYQQTAGELGALLLEASLVKKHKPLLNKRLRRCKGVLTYELIESAGVSRLEQRFIDSKDYLPKDNHYGLFDNLRQGQAILLALAKKYQLCLKTLGLEKGRGRCFGRQVGRCRGVCCGEEPASVYNSRLNLVIQSLRQCAWPFKGRVSLTEVDPDLGLKDVHYIDQWRYLGSSFGGLDVADNGQKALPIFDRDHYRILMSFVAKLPASTLTLNTE